MVAISKNQVCYGPFEFDANEVAEFIAWTIRQSDEITRRLLYLQPGSLDFGVAWLDITDEAPASFLALQYKFKMEVLK